MIDLVVVSEGGSVEWRLSGGDISLTVSRHHVRPGVLQPGQSQQNLLRHQPPNIPSFPVPAGPETADKRVAIVHLLLVPQYSLSSCVTPGEEVSWRPDGQPLLLDQRAGGGPQLAPGGRGSSPLSQQSGQMQLDTVKSRFYYHEDFMLERRGRGESD